MPIKDDNPFLPDVEVADETISVSSIGSSFSTSSHAVSCFFHVLFKGLSLFLYIFGGIIINSTLQTVLVVLFNAVDFYIVKNFSGRYLVGLRWWSVVNDDGLTNTFRFEKSNHPESVTKADSRVFWTFLIVSTASWCFFSITAIFGMKPIWLIVCLLGACLSGYNLYAFMRAARNSNTVMSMFSFIPKSVTKKAVEKISNAALSMAQSSFANSVSIICF